MWQREKEYFNKVQLSHLWQVLILFLIAGGLYFFVFDNCAQVEIELVLPPEVERSDFKIYYAGKNKPYSERRMAGVSTTPTQKLYRFYLTDLAKVARLRVDTHVFAGEVLLKRLKISQNGFADVLFDSPEMFSLLTPLQQISKIENGSEGLRIFSSGGDPFLEFDHIFERAERQWDMFFSGLFIVCVLLLLLVFGGQPLLKEYRYISVFLFGVLLLVVTMAALSRENVHPDEYVHLAAVRYYENHWLPPAVDDPTIAYSFSSYGASRLFDHDLYYFFAGKWSKVFQVFLLHTPFVERLANVMMFACIVFISFRNMTARLVAAPLLISPQVWYLFSYCNSDAFALFLGWLSAWQCIDKRSFFWRFLQRGQMLRQNFSLFRDGRDMLLLGLCLGTLFLVKKNYLPYIIFLYIALALRVWFATESRIAKKTFVMRLIAVSLIGCSLFVGRTALDYGISGANFQLKKKQVRTEMSRPEFRFETSVTDRSPFLAMKERGVGFREAMFTNLWWQKSVQSFFGVFCYFSLHGSAFYYKLIQWCGVVLFCSFSTFYFARTTLAGGLLACSAVILSVALVAASFHHAWTVDFQPQGRYFMPVLPMVGLLCGVQGWILRRLPVVLPLSLLFVLSLYFFIFEGLQRIPKWISG